MDDVADYARHYGGPPPAWLPWLAFVYLVRRVSRYDALEWLRAIQGPSFAVAGLSEQGAGERMMLQDVLFRTAFPELVS